MSVKPSTSFCLRSVKPSRSADKGLEAWRIGAPLQTAKEELLQLGAQLQGILTSSVAAVVTEALGTVRKQYSQIAVLGQIKAGKSSLINALVRRPDMLPTDVNPWTAVVTRLHFARPGQAESGALFSFFDGEEWRRLAAGGGKLKELTQRLAPGYEEKHLRQHLRQMQRRTELRLGKHFQHLLGKSHWYERPTPEIIERYVCSGSLQEELMREPAAGRFADITKTADMFFDADPFVYPSTVIDTPGTNDPLLIRDEVTLRNIERADVYIVVLTARQPLTSADLALLRVLHGLQKNRIIVFINRIDDATDIVSEVRASTAGVRQVLQHEFPNSDIPVVAGSAFWANSALDISNANIDHVWTEQLVDYANHLGVMQAGEPAYFGGHALPDERLVEVLYTCSGLLELAGLISRLMLRGASGYWLSRLASTLQAAAESSTASARNELKSLNEMLHTVQENASLTEELADITKEVERLRKLAAQVDQFLNTLEQELKYETSENLSILSEQLDGDIKAFGIHQGRLLRDAWLEGGHPNWRCDTNVLRNRMEEDVLHAFWATETRLVDAQRRAAPELKRILQEAAPELDFGLVPTSLLSFNLTPSLAPLSRTSALDLDDAWWSHRWKTDRSLDENVLAIEQLIYSEFAPIARELADSAGVELQKYVSSAIQRFFTICSSVVKIIIDREQMLAEACKSLMNADGSAASKSVVEEQEEQITKIRNRISSGEELSRRLSAFMARYAALIADEQRAAG
jgi:hypothetical protein